MEKPPIDSELAFAQVQRISDALVTLGMKHSVVCNPYREPLAVHIPQVMTDAEAAHHADLFNVTDDKSVKIYDTVYPTPATFDVVLGSIRRIQAVSPQTLQPYPAVVTRLVKSVANAVLPGLRPIDYLPAEISSGDSIPHYDFMAKGLDSSYRAGPNIHLTLRGEAAVRVGQVRQTSQIEGMRDAIAEALQNKMTPFEVFNSLTTDSLRHNNDPRVPENLKQSVHHIDEIMGEATPYIALKPGDAFIFHGHARYLEEAGQKKMLLPVVHHFQTTSTIPRVSAVFRTRFDTDVTRRVMWFSPFNRMPKASQHYRVGYGDRVHEQKTNYKTPT